VLNRLIRFGARERWSRPEAARIARVGGQRRHVILTLRRNFGDASYRPPDLHW